MARLEDRLPENADGEFFVDSTCIDCETCMIVAPEVFAESDRQLAFVHHQPTSDHARHRASMALIACPTHSIGTVTRRRAPEAARAFPDPVEENVYYCGYAHESSFGASSYLIIRPEGNVLVDSPRAAGPLLRRIESLGGVKTLFLTHRDDVADHEKFARRFGCERVMHEEDVGPGTAGIERKLTGRDPIDLAPDLTVIPVPGHTRGSAVLLYREKYLFTGDHFWADENGRLRSSKSVSWYSWTEQKKSIEKLVDLPFEWILPGHGRRYHAPTREAARAAMAALAADARKR